MTHDPIAIIRAALEAAAMRCESIPDETMVTPNQRLVFAPVAARIRAIDPAAILSKLPPAEPGRYGRVNIATIQKTKNDLRAAIQSEGTEAIQALWDRLEQWIDSPSMMPPADPWQPKCKECSGTGWQHFACGTPWRCKCQAKPFTRLGTLSPPQPPAQGVT